MNDEQKLATTGGADKVKLGAAIALVIAGVAAYYVLGDNAPLWLRWGAVVAGIGLAAAVLVPSQYGRDARQFIVESRIELRKVVWPSQRETGMTTLIVFGFVVLAGVFFWVVDFVLAWATRHLTGQGS